MAALKRLFAFYAPFSCLSLRVTRAKLLTFELLEISLAARPLGVR